MSKRLTELSIEKIKPHPIKRLEIADTLSGLYLVVQPSGVRSWALRYRQFGKTRKLTIGGYPQFRVAEAREAARGYLERIDRGDDPAAEKAIEKKRRLRGEGIDATRFDNVARLFVVRHAKEKNRSWKTTASRLGLVPDPAQPDKSDDPLVFTVRKGSLVDRWGYRPIESIERREIIAFLDDLIAAGYGTGANRIRAALSKLMNWAIGRDLIEVNPVEKVSPPAAEVSRDRVLTDDELRAIWHASLSLNTFGPIFRLLILTGQRRQEVVSMRWDELDFEKAEWVVPASRSKNGKVNVVHLAPAAFETLKSQPRVKGSPYVFTTNGRNPVSGLSKAKIALHNAALAFLREEAKERGDDAGKVLLADWRPHDFRRTAATGMARLGVRLEVIEKILNHESGSFAGVAGVYQRFEFGPERKVALDTWARFVLGLVGDRVSNVIPLKERA